MNRRAALLHLAASESNRVFGNEQTYRLTADGFPQWLQDGYWYAHGLPSHIEYDVISTEPKKEIVTEQPQGFAIAPCSLCSTFTRAEDSVCDECFDKIVAKDSETFEKLKNACNDGFDGTLAELRSYFRVGSDAVRLAKWYRKTGIDEWRGFLTSAVSSIDELKEAAKSQTRSDQTEVWFIELASLALCIYATWKGSITEWSDIESAVFPLIDRMAEIHAIKGHDYNDRVRPYNNCRVSEEMGIPGWKGVLIRLSDKIERLCAFAQQGELKVRDESIQDTCLDAANYALIGLILYRETLETKLVGKHPMNEEMIILVDGE